VSAESLAGTPAVKSPHRVVRTSSLEIAYEASGPEDGFPVVLL
jgi:hypothetical protein